MIRLIVHGAEGRMGTRICTLARADSRFQLVAARSRGNAHDAAAAGAVACDVVIDFSSPEGTTDALRTAASAGAALLVGTTGLSAENLRELDDAARSTAVMIAPNTSLGVAVLSHLAARAAQLLGGEFDVDIVESHHAGKRDAPSGTALRLAVALAEGGGFVLPPERIHSVRAGEIVGDHTIVFAGPGECLRISHSAVSRDVFAAGALRAAAWLCGRSPGRYRIEHALGPKVSSRS